MRRLLMILVCLFFTQTTTASAAVNYLGYELIQHSSDGSAGVTIPVGTDAIVACLTGYANGTYQYLVDELNFDGANGLDFTYIDGSRS